MSPVAKADTTFPSEIKRMVGTKYKIVVSISTKSFSPNSRELSFQINRIIETFKPDLPSSPFGFGPELPGTSSSQSPTHLPPTSPVFSPRTPSAASILQSPLSHGSFGIPGMSPPLEVGQKCINFAFLTLPSFTNAPSFLTGPFAAAAYPRFWYIYWFACNSRNEVLILGFF